MVLPKSFLHVVGTYEGRLPLSESSCGGDSTWRWWGHLNVILRNRTCFELFVTLSIRNDVTDKPSP